MKKKKISAYFFLFLHVSGPLEQKSKKIPNFFHNLFFLHVSGPMEQKKNLGNF